MSRAKEVGTAVGTLVCALCIGFAMQSTDTASQRYGISAQKNLLKPTEGPINEEMGSLYEDLMDVHDITLTSALPASTQPVAVTAGVVSMNPVSTVAKTLSVAATGLDLEEVIAKSAECKIRAEALPREAAFVQLDLHANCRPNEQVTVHHNGMLFTGDTGSDGSMSVTVPALSKTALFIFAFQDGKGTLATTMVDDIEDYKRVVLQWRGSAGFELHAREFDVENGENGHVWHGANASVSGTANGEGGVLTSLGHRSAKAPHLAQVYSVPTRFSDSLGQIDLSVEAVINQDNCGSSVEAQTLEWDGVSELRTQNLTLEIPTCDSIGEYLVLNNVFEDLKVATK